MFQVEFVSKRVKKEFEEFENMDKRALEQALKLLEKNPRPLDLDFGHVNRCSEIKRIKVGRARVFYIIDEAGGRIWIGRLENRNTVT